MEKKEYLSEWPPLSRSPSPVIEPKKKTRKEEVVFENVSGDEIKLIYKDPNMEVFSLLAQWWKWKQLRLEDSTHSPAHYDLSSHNPNTRLHYISKLPCAQEFLKLRINFLEDFLEEKSEEGRVKGMLATCHYLLGHIKEAMSIIQDTINDDNSEEQELKWKYHLINKQYTILIKQEKASRTMLTQQLPKMIKVERRDCSLLSFEDFFYNYAMRGKPVIITGLKITSGSQPWTLKYIKSVIGHRSAPLRRSVPDSVEWAKLEPCGSLNVMEFIDSLNVQDKDSLKYLFDWSIPLYCPELARELIIPKYFSSDLLQRTPPGSLYRDSWPSLFIAPPGITSSLHIDAFGSNFWMALFEGRKRWVFYPPQDLPFLYPQYYMHSTDPVFPQELSKEEYPLVSCTHPMECILEVGEVLFVPAGSPHQVNNLEASLAISANFVDLSNIELVCEELKINSLVDPRAQDLLNSINKLSLSVDTSCQKDLLWSEFKRSKN